MNWFGMDLDAAERAAHTLENHAAAEVLQVIGAMDGLIPRLMEAWKGADAERFADDWRQHRLRLQQAHQSIGSLAGQVVSHVAAQRATSNG